MAKVTLNKMGPKDSLIYAQPVQIGGLRAASKAKPVNPFTPHDPLSREPRVKSKLPNKTK